MAGRLENILSWTCKTCLAIFGVGTVIAFINPTRSWTIPTYTFDRRSRHRWLSWLIMKMLPMIGRPSGPGGWPRLRHHSIGTMKRKKQGIMDRWKGYLSHSIKIDFRSFVISHTLVLGMYKKRRENCKAVTGKWKKKVRYASCFLAKRKRKVG